MGANSFLLEQKGFGDQEDKQQVTNVVFLAGVKRALLFLCFPLFFVLLLFSTSFENALLFSPKMFDVTERCNFFPPLFRLLKNIRLI